MAKQQTEKQSGEDQTESLKETLSENQGNLTSFNITIKSERRQYQILSFSREYKTRYLRNEAFFWTIEHGLFRNISVERATHALISSSIADLNNFFFEWF